MANAPADWVVETCADFNGDGKDDILWRSPNAQQMSIWLMDGKTILGQGSSTTISDYNNWVVAGVGDLNNDRRADIFWRNRQTATVGFWLMDGVNPTLMTGAGTVSIDFTAQLADLNADGKMDIIWRNASTSQVAFWLMDGVRVIDAKFGPSVDANWYIAGVGDLNADHKADLVWRNATTDDVGFWLMNGIALSQAGGVAKMSGIYTLQGLADLNLDGKADLVWRNIGTSGDVSFWLVNGMNLLGTATTPSFSQSWRQLTQQTLYRAPAKPDLAGGWLEFDTGRRC